MKKQKSRLNKLIENDRLIISSEMSSLINYDLKNLLNNYFNLEGNSTISLSAGKDGYLIEIKVKASGVKAFNSLHL